MMRNGLAGSAAMRQPGANRQPGAIRWRQVSRAALLILSALSGCAANDYGGDDAGPTSTFKPTGVFGAYLVGRYAARHGEPELAADKLEFAARETGVREIANQAFIAAVLADRPGVADLADGLPDNPVAQLVLADRDAKAGRWTEAEARFAALAPEGLTFVLRPLLVAWAEAGQGRTAAALTTLQPFVDAGRLRGVMALHAGLIADLGGQTVDAVRLYRLAQAEYGAVNLRLGTTLASWQARNGYMTEAQRIIGEIAGQGELAMSRPALEAHVADRAVRTPSDGIAEAYLAMGATLRQQNSTDSATVLMHLALSMRPDFTAARLLLADLQQQGNQVQAALATLQAVPADDPLAAIATMRRATLLEAAGESDASVQLLEQMAAQYPDRPEPLAIEGDLLRQKGRYQESLAVYDRALTRVGTPNRGSWPLFYQRGVAYERAGDWPRAEADFQYALRLAPDQASVLNYLGYAWTERGEHLAQARGMIERAVQQRPNEASFIDSLGWALLKAGDGPGALKNLERAVELQSEDPVINGHLGDALAAVGRWREAEFQWRRALTLKPDPDDAARIERVLSTMPAVKSAGPPPANARTLR